MPRNLAPPNKSDMNASTIILTILFAILFLLALGFCIRHGMSGCGYGRAGGSAAKETECCCCGCCKSCSGLGCQHHVKKQKETH